MSFAVQPEAIVTYLLVMTRMITVFTVAPPFGSAFVPLRVRVAIAAAVSLLISPLQPDAVPLDVASLIAALAYQVVVGAIFGYLILLLLSAPLIAGAMVDFLAGFSAAGVFDPFSQSSATPVARINQMVAMVILVVLEGHLLVVRGVLRSYEVAPLQGLRVGSLGEVLAEGIGQLILAAIEIVLPLLVAMLLTEVVLGLAARAAPRLNVMVLGFAIKSFVLLIGFSVVLPLIINSIATLLGRSIRWALFLVGA